MKVSLALGKRGPLSRQMAWGCYTTNLAMPGCGSLFAGRKVGYLQFALTAIAFALTSIFGLRAIYWFLANWTKNQQLQDEGADYLAAVWEHVRWAFLGMGLFFVALAWSWITSLDIMAESRAFEAMNKLTRPIPPKLSR